MNGYINEIFTGVELPPQVEEMMTSYAFIFSLAVVIACCILAAWGYKIFRASLSIVGATVFGTIGGTVIGPLVVNSIGDVLPGTNVSAIIGFVLALVGAILMGAIYKLGIFVSGASIGYLFGSVITVFLASLFPEVEFLNSETGVIVVSIVAAIILGILSIFLFKFIYILTTSVGGMALAGLMVGTTIFNEPNETVLIVSLIIGAIIGIFAMVRQYKNADEF